MAADSQAPFPNTRAEVLSSLSNSQDFVMKMQKFKHEIIL